MGKNCLRVETEEKEEKLHMLHTETEDKAKGNRSSSIYIKKKNCYNRDGDISPVRYRYIKITKL